MWACNAFNVFHLRRYNYVSTCLGNMGYTCLLLMLKYAIVISHWKICDRRRGTGNPPIEMNISELVGCVA